MNLFCRAAALLILPLVSSCSLSPGDKHSHFHEQAATDVVVRFSTWDTITISKPDTRGKDGFLPLYRLAEAKQILARPEIPRHLAAVIYGYHHSLQQEADLQKQWTALFASLGFQRVVFLHVGFEDQVNGLPVVKDIQLGLEAHRGG